MLTDSEREHLFMICLRSARGPSASIGKPHAQKQKLTKTTANCDKAEAKGTPPPIGDR